MTKEELESKLLESVLKVNEYYDGAHMYWKGVRDTYQTILNGLYGKDWDSTILDQ